MKISTWLKRLFCSHYKLDIKQIVEENCEMYFVWYCERCGKEIKREFCGYSKWGNYNV